MMQFRKIISIIHEEMSKWILCCCKIAGHDSLITCRSGTELDDTFYFYNHNGIVCFLISNH